jgi:hypothetical protein
VRVGIRTLGSLALCAAAAGAALAHWAIDVVGDYALARDSYDHLQHGSRELITAIALMLAAVLAVRGLGICCEIATIHRTRLVRPVMALRELLSVVGASVGLSLAIVPGMEYLDGRLDGVPVHRLGDAFGGSIPLGVATTLVCAGLVALLACGLARWLISHRDSIATIIETLLRATAGAHRPSDDDLFLQLFTPRRRRTMRALRLSKRGPPEFSFANLG